MKRKMWNNALLIALLSMQGPLVQAQQTAYCCPGRNMILNGGFDSGNTGFTSAYTYQAGYALNSVDPGEYGIMTSAQATAVAPNWNPACPAENNHLVVNGRTMQSGEQVVWQQTVTLTKGVSYKFCGKFKNLPQTSFDIKPKVSLRFSIPGVDVNNVTINVGNTGCSWQQIQQTLFVAGSGTIPVTIKIYLSEVGNGDGNDLAIDNLFLVPIPQVPVTDVAFDVNFFNTSGGVTNIEATPVVPVPQGCYFYWDVKELDANYNVIPGTDVYSPSAWWFIPCRFWGYVGTSTLGSTANPGVFYLNKRYRIAYGRWCDCQTWNAYAVIVEWVNASVVIREDPVTEADNPGTINQRRAGARVADAGSGDALIALNAIPGLPDKTARVFPNPTNSSVTVLLTPCKEDSKVELLSTAGKVLQTFSVKTATARMDISLARYPAGIYLLQHKNKEGKLLLNEKVVKQ